jgi:thiamine-monophosphate kinase
MTLTADNTAAGTLADIGERAWIRRLLRLLPAVPPGSVGIGDDCAVVRAGGDRDWLLKSDPVIEGTHFTVDAPAEGIGHKAIGRVLSDLAAMGGEPDWILVDLVAPGATSVARLEAIYRTASALARRYGATIVGGDSSRGPVLELHVFGVGHVPSGRAVRRMGARPGDAIYVTGALGGSGLGRHLAFEPRIAQGVWLREKGWASAMLDVSDGLATDLLNLVEASGVGARIESSKVPLSDAARALAGERTALHHALYDGEDFELLFTVPAGRDRDFASAWREAFDLPCSRIGTVTDRPGQVEYVDEAGQAVPLAAEGFRHFQ